MNRQHERRFTSSKAPQKDAIVTIPRIIDRGDGPKIAGTRITVYTVLEYLRAGRTRDWIAALLQVSSAQVQTAIDYIEEHDTQVNAAYATIVARIKQGNPCGAHLFSHRVVTGFPRLRPPRGMSHPTLDICSRSRDNKARSNENYEGPEPCGTFSVTCTISASWGLCC